ncbi:MAG TPA: hypothetical protein PLX03_11175, partial [Candidatus Hydrogenedentes bacterium]|nr:hypothetical protein [Candidatus Hydrogenedentota bacterium]
CTGTGLKVCVLLHLPALTLMGLPKLYPGTAKTRDVAFCGVAAGSGLDLPHLGAPPSEPQQLSATPYMPVEPITEQCLLTEIEGFIPVPPEKSPGALYAVFNQHSLGVSEEEIAYGVYHAAREWCVKEEETRLTLLKSNRLWLQDWVGRAVALARGTHIAGFGEALDWISRIRLGAALGLLRMPGLTPAALNRMLIEIQAAHLANGTSEELSSRLHLARLRAEKLRAFLAQCEITAS